jgi:hypothetical protein
MKKNWNKEKDKFNKKLNSIFFVIHLKYIYIYGVYKLWFCTCYNMYKIIVHVITWTMQKYKLCTTLGYNMYKILFKNGFNLYNIWK